MKVEAIKEIYQNRLDKASKKIDAYQKQANLFSNIRLAIFILFFPIFYFLLKTNLYLLLVFSLLLLIVFVAAVIRQQHYQKLKKESETYKIINENEINMLNEGPNIYFDGTDYEQPKHLFSGDLDVFGPHSLFGLINRSKTYQGSQYLRKWLLEKPTKKELQLRQDAVKELEPEIDFRQRIAANLFNLHDLHHYDIAKAIDQHLKLDLSSFKATALSWYIRLIPVLWVVIGVLFFLFPDKASTLASILFIGNLFLVMRYNKGIMEVQNVLSLAGNSLGVYIDALKVLFDHKWKSALLRDAQTSFEKDDQSIPIASLNKLTSITNHLDYRLNLLVAILLNGLVSWDIRVVQRLVRWQKNHTDEVHHIFDFLGLMEALSSLATFSYNNPEYSYLEISPYFQLSAEEVRHPLIPLSQNVANDFMIAETDHISIITGSNMSGKSTFLRTLGANMILGYTGTRVAAKRLAAPIATVITYMRIKDALEENVSTFKAELNRVSLILSMLEKDKECFILIDEMLRGTNSKDKLAGSIGITKKLMETNTYAMIATHDIKLAEMGVNIPKINNYYFDIDFVGEDLVFDYKIKPGICENFNASILLKKIGIE